MPGVAREKRFPERGWRGATATDIGALRAWMLARHSRRHSDELEDWITAIAEWRPPPALSHHKVRWFRSVLLRYGPPGRRWEPQETPDTAYRRIVRTIRTARLRRQNERKRSPAPPRTSCSHPADAVDPTVAPLPSTGRSGARSRPSSRTNGSTNGSTNGHGPAVAADPTPPPEPAREQQLVPPHW